MHKTGVFMMMSGLFFSASDAGAQTAELARFQLEDKLGRVWPLQWITYQAQLQPGQAKAEDLWVDEPGHPAVEHGIWVKAVHPDGSAAEVTVSIRTQLEPGQSRAFFLVKNAAAAASRASLVQLVAEENRLVLKSDQLEMHLPKYETAFNELVAPEKAPPPILGLGGIGQVVTLPAHLEGAEKIKAVRGERLPSPAHQLKYRVTYDLANGGKYHLIFELPAGDPVVLVEEDFMDCATGALVLDLYAFAKPNMGHFMPHRVSPSKQGVPGNERHYQIQYAEKNDLSLQPFYSWYTDQTIWWGCYQKGGEDYWGLMALQPTHWINPIVNLPRVVAGPGPANQPKLDLRLPLRAGKRRWGLFLCPQAEAPVNRPDPCPIANKYIIRYAQNPLDTVKELVLDWPGDEVIACPRLLCASDQVPAIRQKAQTSPYFQRILKEKPDGPNDPAGLYLATGDEQQARQARDLLIKFLQSKLENLFSYGYMAGDNVCIGHSRPVRDMAFVYDLIASSPAMSVEDRRFCRRAFAFLAEAMSNHDYWITKEQGIPRGNVNFHSDWFTCITVVAALLPGHPRYDEWLRAGEQEMDDELERNVCPGGAWTEAPNYHGYTIHFLMLAMRAMQNAGYKDYTQDQRLRDTMTFLLEMQTPHDIRAHHAMLPTMGDTTSYYHSQSLQVVFAWMATLSKQDPEFAGRMMYAWERTGHMLVGVHNLGPGAGWTFPLTLVDPSIPSVAPQPVLQSKRFPGFGVILRNNNGTDHESMVWYKHGIAGGHYDQDEGTFHWYARGIPLSLDFGSMYQPSISQPWYHNTLAFDHKCVWNPGDVSSLVSFDGLDYLASQITVRNVQAQPEIPGDPVPAGMDDSIKHAVEFVAWRRQLIMVKGPDYLVLRDDLKDGWNQVGTEWAIQVLADKVQVTPGRAEFVGQLGMDLAVVFADPAQAKLATGEWSHKGQNYPDWMTEFPMGPMGERQISLHAYQPANGNYLAVLFPYKHEGEAPARITPLSAHTVRVEHPGGDDLVFFGDKWGAYEAEGIRFSGRVAVVRRQPKQVTVWLLEGDCLTLPELSFSCQGPGTFIFGEDWIDGQCEGTLRSCDLHWEKPPGIPTVTIDGKKQYCSSSPDGYLTMFLPEGRHRFQVRYKPDVNVWEF